MEKIIIIDNKKIKFKASAATPRKYREVFGRDIFSDIADALKKGKETKLATVLENVAYIMALQANENIGSFYEWLDGFSPKAIYKIQGEILALWNANTTCIENRKKKVPQRTVNH